MQADRTAGVPDDDPIAALALPIHRRTAGVPDDDPIAALALPIHRRIRDGADPDQILHLWRAVPVDRRADVLMLLLILGVHHHPPAAQTDGQMPLSAYAQLIVERYGPTARRPGLDMPDLAPKLRELAQRPRRYARTPGADERWPW